MALISKHYLIATAIKAALNGDAELVAAIPTTQWKVQKKAWHRGMTWTPGCYVVPLRGSKLVHENRNLRIIFDTVVAAVWPADADLTINMEAELALQERIDMIFSGQGRTTMPGSLRGLDLIGVGTANHFNVEHTDSRPGENFMSGAFERGFDAFASIISVTVVTAKLNASTLGA